MTGDASLVVTSGDRAARPAVPSRAGADPRCRDGAAPAFLDDEEPCRSPLQHSEHLLARYGRELDDALVLVARFGAHAMPTPNPGLC
jgi:hypothetical protein